MTGDLPVTEARMEMLEGPVGGIGRVQSRCPDHRIGPRGVWLTKVMIRA
jgi:hypothetical protein